MSKICISFHQCLICQFWFGWYCPTLLSTRRKVLLQVQLTSKLNRQVESFPPFTPVLQDVGIILAADVVSRSFRQGRVFLATNAYIFDVSCISSLCGGTYMNVIPGPKLFAKYQEHFCATQHWSSSWVI